MGIPEIFESEKSKTAVYITPSENFVVKSQNLF